jgi:hypothetical protein
MKASLCRYQARFVGFTLVRSRGDVTVSRRTPALYALDKADPVLLGRRIRQAKGRGEFDSFCLSHRIHSRKAYDLIAIADAVDRDLLQEKVVQEIGWSKARLIGERARTKPDARRAIAFARSNTLPALTAYFQHEGKGVALVTKSFHLTKTQADELNAALIKAGAQLRKRRMNGRTDALMRILRGYR